IILGGIYSGVFTATESAGIAVVYGLIVSMFIYKDIKPRELLPMFMNTAKTTANLMILIAAANLFGYLIGYFNIPKALTAFVQTYAHTKLAFMIIVGIILLICGMFMEAIAVVVILAPILAPMAASFGVNPIQFGCYMVFILCLGIATPPFAPSMFVACGITKQPITKVTKQIMPFIIEQIIVAILVGAIPAISLGFVSLFR
ncbi:MAG: TRAP transporter large permease subunit, partial [Lachnospiraceae bacterium]|nr:TRAP transporter large permease subunit [Lachnospiraceae bacterium]